ncbi:MAG: 2-hydroxy-3-oxopropionate reductase [Gammaproteobacteria bacterium]|nr:2-hydroxy-3-oxopropionate reductase [Gammaproteobacteria bacterium]MDH3407058.1 2-hydroxy-3-oxopropionate reductase [Gammaproteobacteria bacterium]MDH5487353.1 2-hydroxy-3-oxopropionate reductase [Gammaproteobacteria bacterium]
MKLGFIGLGIMGRPMALNLRKANHTLWVHGRRPVTMEVLVEAGAHACHTVADVAAHAEVIFIMVSDTPDVENIVLGETGLMPRLRSGQVVVDMSTISPAATRHLAQTLEAQGVEMLDAPVSGGEIGAINAALSIMVGGKENTYRRVKPLFDVLGKNVVYVGDHGAGQVAKACNQIVAALTIEAVSEALTFARRNGVDAAKVREALMGGFAGSKILEIHGKRMLDNDFRPGFTVKLHQKDLRIVMEDAHKLGVGLPGAALVAQHLNALMGSGDGELDSAAIVKVVERMSDPGS